MNELLLKTNMRYFKYNCVFCNDYVHYQKNIIKDTCNCFKTYIAYGDIYVDFGNLFNNNLTVKLHLHINENEIVNKLTIVFIHHNNDKSFSYKEHDLIFDKNILDFSKNKLTNLIKLKLNF